MFLRQEYDLGDFQSRLETAAFPIEIEVMKHSILNELEEIRFTKLEMNHYRYGAEVAQRLLNILN
ncbi:hypothetical protein [Paenibacillus antibioticophila]|uniref:hypothetical protein n=1 Tax=Paenibacillus antibioticophila TaxID=1274374 RepID=UPI0005CB6BDB|nr:hypothetical protein [Paenibacillus antibioticophila]